MRTQAFAALGVVLASAAGLADDWPQWRGPKRDGVWRETGVVDVLPKELRYKWRTPIGEGYAGPAVAGSRVYVMDRRLAPQAANPSNPFAKTPVAGGERVLCLDARSGEILWEHAYECPYAISYPYGPRVTPSVVDGKLYTVGAMGNFWCLDAQTGAVVWSKDYKADYGMEVNTWGMAAHPLVDGDKVFLLVAGDAGVVALHKDTGEEIWRALELVDPGYCPPIVVEAGGVRQLIVWTPVGLYSLNPETGATFWRQERRLNHGLSVSQPIYDPESRLLMITSFYEGALAMRLDADAPTASLAWEQRGASEIMTKGLHSIMPTPYFDRGFIYGVCSYGQLRCLRAEDGERVWETFEATGEGRWWNAFLVRHEQKTILANEQGDLVFAKLSPEGYRELSRTRLIEPTGKAGRRDVVWSHPAFAHRCVFARNDREILCADLSDSER